MIGSQQDWLNQNSLRSYPLDYEINPVADTGFVLPDTLLTDCMVVIQGTLVPPILSSVHFSASLVSVVFRDPQSGADLFMAQSSIFEDYVVAQIISLGSINISGNVSFGSISSLFSFVKTGIHKFDPLSNSIYPHCVMNIGAPIITSISANLDNIIGDVAIETQGSLAASVTDQVVNGVTTHNVVLYLRDPITYIEECAPAQNLCDCLFNTIGQINTVSADVHGNINLIIDPSFGNGISIESVYNSVIISLAQPSASACGTNQTLPFPDGRLPSESNVTS